MTADARSLMNSPFSAQNMFWSRIASHHANTISKLPTPPPSSHTSKDGSFITEQDADRAEKKRKWEEMIDERVNRLVQEYEPLDPM
jgi:hypothetical protein